MIRITSGFHKASEVDSIFHSGLMASILHSSCSFAIYYFCLFVLFCGAGDWTRTFPMIGRCSTYWTTSLAPTTYLFSLLLRWVCSPCPWIWDDSVNCRRSDAIWHLRPYEISIFLRQVSKSDLGTLVLEAFLSTFHANSLSQLNAILCSCKFLFNYKSFAIVSGKTGKPGGIPPLITSQVKALCLKHEYWSHLIHATKIPVMRKPNLDRWRERGHREIQKMQCVSMQIKPFKSFLPAESSTELSWEWPA
jgi:hypothetical protein